MSAEILLVCLDIIFMGMEIFVGWTYVWVIVEWIYGDEGFLG